jgi:hypothetical protein
MKLGASFSVDRFYRYNLFRIWNENGGRMLFILLNPSTADETKDDPTIKRCITRAFALGYGGIEIVNLFAMRSTYPHNLFNTSDPVGPENDLYILGAVERTELVVCGWGKHGNYLDRAKTVLGIVRSCNRAPHYLKLNSDGTPRHPLYVPYSVFPVSLD